MEKFGFTLIKLLLILFSYLIGTFGYVIFFGLIGNIKNFGFLEKNVTLSFLLFILIGYLISYLFLYYYIKIIDGLDIDNKYNLKNWSEVILSVLTPVTLIAIANGLKVDQDLIGMMFATIVSTSSSLVLIYQHQI